MSASSKRYQPGVVASLPSPVLEAKQHCKPDMSKRPYKAAPSQQSVVGPGEHCQGLEVMGHKKDPELLLGTGMEASIGDPEARS